MKQLTQSHLGCDGQCDGMQLNAEDAMVVIR